MGVGDDEVVVGSAPMEIARKEFVAAIGASKKAIKTISHAARQSSVSYLELGVSFEKL